MVDFDKLFEEYFRNWYAKNKNNLTPDEAENSLPEVYEEWVTTPCAELDGQSPEQFLLAITDVKVLIDAFSEGNDSSLLLDRMMDMPECVPYLIDLINKNESAVVTVSAMDLLEEMNAQHPFETYVKMLADENADDAIREKCAEILKQYASLVKDNLFPLIEGAGETLKQMIAEILVETDKDERTYNLLRDLFLSGSNVPYAAGLIGKYGDERAAEFLYPALDVCNYLEFIEIRNAIEQMGGVVDDNYRDFSDDEFYKAIKNLK